MSLHLILLGGPKSGKLHEVSDLRTWREGDEIAFCVWPPFPTNSQEDFEQWPVVPKWHDVYRIEVSPLPEVPGTATYAGRRP